MTRATLIAFMIFIVIGAAAVAAFAIIDRTVGEILFAIVLCAFVAYGVARVVKGIRDNKQ